MQNAKYTLIALTCLLLTFTHFNLRFR